MKSINTDPRYRKEVCYGGLGRYGRRSIIGERRSKKSFRKWLRRKNNQEEVK